MHDQSRLFPPGATILTAIERPKRVRLIAEYDDGGMEVITWQRPHSTELIPPDLHAREPGQTQFRISAERPEWIVLPPEEPPT